MKNLKFIHDKSAEGWQGYALGLLTTLTVGIVCYPASEVIGYLAIGLVFLMSVPVLSIFVGRGPVLMVAILNFAIWNFFFIPPVMTFHIGRFHDLIALFTFLGVALASGILITRMKKNELILKQTQDRFGIINSFLESLNHAGSIREVVRTTQEAVTRQFGNELVVYLREKNGKNLSDKAFGNTELYSESEFHSAVAVFNNQVPEESRIHYFPLAVQRGNIGVIGIDVGTSRIPDEGKNLLLKLFIAQTTSALNREINIDIAKEKEIFMESQKLFQTVLSSVSHELKTPIAIISTAVSTLDDDNTAANPEIRKQVCQELSLAAKRLTILVENILDMSKIESGYFKLQRQSYDVTELFGIAVNEVKSDFNPDNLRINISENLPPLYVDIHWFKQAIINILRNAIHYTPPGSDIFFNAWKDENDSVIIEILDSGSGVPEQSLDKLFEKFYRVPGTKIGGTGLGLAISRAIVEAHKGLIFALNKAEGGLSVIIVMGRKENE